MKALRIRRFLTLLFLALFALSSFASFETQAEPAQGSTIEKKPSASGKKSQRKKPRRARRARKRATETKSVVNAKETTEGEASNVIVHIGERVPDAPQASDAEEESPSPPKPQSAPSPRTYAPIRGGVLNGKATQMAEPVYPPIARAARAEGPVVVRVVIDENGDVISAEVVSGHPLLQQSAVNAVRQWRFSPTLLSGKPVKVTGLIVINYKLK